MSNNPHARDRSVSDVDTDRVATHSEGLWRALPQ